jgi:P-type Mg2+ transporter
MIDLPLDRFWYLPTQALLERLSATPEGLSRNGAEDRLARYGPNTVAEPSRLDIVRKIGRRFAEPLVAILLVAAAISGATGDLGSFGIIVTVIVLSIGLDLFQEHRAERAAEALKRSVAVHADVRRDGMVTAIPVDQLVPGDVVELRAGDLVPADGIVLESRNAHANEALMTGEPYPADKYPGPCTATTPPEAFNALFAGTSIVSGEAIMLVVATGKATRFSGIAAELAARQPPRRNHARLRSGIERTQHYHCRHRPGLFGLRGICQTYRRSCGTNVSVYKAFALPAPSPEKTGC